MEDEGRMNGGRGRHAQKRSSRFKDSKHRSTKTSEAHETHQDVTGRTSGCEVDGAVHGPCTDQDRPETAEQ